MNAINVIAPYKYLGMWVFDDPRAGLVQEPFVSGADTMIDRVVSDYLVPKTASSWCSLTTRFRGISSAWIGAAPSLAATGIFLPTSILKDGSAPRCSSISTKRRSIFTCRSSQTLAMQGGEAHEPMGGR